MTSMQPGDSRAASAGLTSKEIPKSRDRPGVYRFAATSDGFRHFGDDWGEALDRLRRDWAINHALPWDLDDLRAWLAVEVRAERFVDLDGGLRLVNREGREASTADPDLETRARAGHELRKSAIVDRIRALVVCRERGLPAPTAERPIHALIPRTSMLERYLDLTGSQKARLARAERDELDPTGLITDFIESVARFAAYSNVDEAFYRDRPPPCPGPDLWRTEDISGRLLKMQKLELKTAAPAETSAPGPGPAPKDLGLNYVDREIVAARTEATRPTHRMQGVELVRHDLLLRSLDGGLPIVGEVKTPTDADAYYALIQLLAAASQLVTPDQATRLRNQAREATFVDVTQDRRVDLALVFVDPLRCGRTVTPTKGPQPYRPKLDAIAPRIAELILGSYGIGDYVRRIFRVDVGLVGDDLEGVVAWAFEADTATHA